MSTRILLIENQPLTRLGVKAVFADAADIEVVGETDNAVDGFRFFQELRPDVTILGLRLPDSCAIDDLDNYLVANPNAKVLVLAEHAGDAEIRKALQKGAAGYVCKDVSPNELMEAIRTLVAGRKYIPADIAQILTENISQEELTPAESNILRMIVGGMSNKEIAFALDISENTVKSHIQNIFGKIGVSDRTSAATTAIKRGLVRIDL
ncbi:LuxR C-terminal-related transcriptional regulator [Leptolyngbya sp. 7M]|uniref:LuxR C-terminal-related transcriptional regulator n=1 Tax=Leptolyngbya sp. 7M TaxID=2812896 RepID=UPI001B8D336B|nr:response regulator transcription factor [Leptolyngbya sp. 7M]QYO65470.1 response regulator transcription factor [Leptolyngbya sp. 7M]